MANNVAVWHFPDIIVGHSLSKKVFSSLKDISNKDYPDKRYFEWEIPALDIDRYEKSLGGDNQKTVDAVIGICNERQGKPINGRLLLVELRMKYENVDNLSISALLGKESHTREILRDCPDDVPIDASYCLVFDYKIEQYAYNWLSRQQRSNPNLINWKSFSPTTFCNYINISVQFPYTPKKETILMGDRFKSAAQSGEIDIFDIEATNIKEYITTCGLIYEHRECEYLSDIVIEAFSLFDKTQLSDEYEKAYLEVIMDDLLKITTKYHIKKQVGSNS